MDDAPNTGGGDATLGEELRALFTEARSAANAEILYQSARAKLAGKYLARLLGLGALALALAFFALMALVIGVLLALLAPLGAWGATAAVVLGLLIATLLTALMARTGWRRLHRLFTNRGA